MRRNSEKNHNVSKFVQGVEIRVERKFPRIVHLPFSGATRRGGAVGIGFQPICTFPGLSRCGKVSGFRGEAS